jgi:photosystem II stability/assembly factor-like uncharacterized protein
MRKKVTKNMVLMISIFLLMLSFSARAQWESKGPYGGYIKHLVEHAGSLYAVGGWNGFELYRSDDQGDTWNKISTTNLPNTVKGIASNDELLFVVAGGDGVYVSADNGQSWVAKNNGIPLGSGVEVSTIMTVGDDVFIAGTPSLLMKSTDFGETWEMKNTGTLSNLSFMLMSHQDNILFVAEQRFRGTGLWRSLDYGESWQQTYTGIPGPFRPMVYSLCVTEDAIYLGAESGKGIYKSVNSGDSWEFAGSDTQNHGNITSINCIDEVIVAGTSAYPGTAVLRSENGGSSWSFSLDTFAKGLPVKCGIKHGNNIFLGTEEGGLHKSIDGQNWTTAHQGITAIEMAYAPFAEVNDNLFVTSRSAGVYRADGENGWLDKSEGLPQPSMNNNFYESYTDHSLFFLPYNSSTSYYSDDNAESWEIFNCQDCKTGVNQYTLWIEHNGARFTTRSYVNAGVFRSTDNGESWEPITNGITDPQNTVYTYLYSNDGTIFLGTTSGLYYSNNNGNTWNLGNFPNFYTWSFNYPCFATVDDVVVCGIRGSDMAKGLYRTIDGGANWTSISEFSDYEAYRLKTDTAGNIIAAASSEDDGGLYLSDDKGLTWTKISSSLSQVHLSSLYVKNSSIYAASGNNVYRTTNQGDSWINLTNNQVPAYYLNPSFHIHEHNDYLYIGTNYFGVWQAPLEQLLPPSQPTDIEGSIAPCIGAEYTYSVDDIPNTTFTWQVPSDWTIVSGQGSHAIEVTVGNASGVIIVTPTNPFGTGPAQAITVSPTSEAPSQPGDITGPVEPIMDTEVTYSVEPVYGLSYDWSFPAGWVQMSGDNTHLVTVMVGEASGSVSVTASSPCGTSEPSVIVVSTINPYLPAVFNLLGGGSYCEGGEGLEITLSGSESGSNYTLFKDGEAWLVDVPGTGDILSFGPQLMGVYTASASNSAGTVEMNGSAMVVESAAIPVSVTVETIAVDVCQGEEVTINAIPVNGGNNPVFEWFLNGSAVGENLNEFSFVPENGDQVFVVLTSDLGGCVTGNPAISNTLSFTVNELLDVEVQIIADNLTICEGSTITFTALPTNGGENPVYQWFVNDEPTGEDADTFSYQPMDGDQVFVEITSDIACAANNPAVSNVLEPMVMSSVVAEVTIEADQDEICLGSTITFTAYPVNGGNNPLYQWFVNSAAVSGATQSIYTYAPAEGDVVFVEMTSDLDCVTNVPAQSNSIEPIVTLPVTPEVSITVSDNPVNAGTEVTFTALPVNGGTSPSFHWYLNDDLVSSGSSFTYLPEDGDMVYVVLISSLDCVTSETAQSEMIVMVVNEIYAHILVQPEMLEQVFNEPNGQATEVLTISNTGLAELNWNAEIEFLQPDNATGWLSLDNASGNIAPDDQQNVEVSFDASGLSENALYTANIVFNSNDPDIPVLSVPVSMALIVGNSELDKQSVMVYPNPASHTLFLRNLEIVSQIRMVNGLGKTVYRSMLIDKKSHHSINTHSLPPGVYLLMMTTQDGKLINETVLISH